MIKDHVDNFELSDEVLAKHANECNSLQYLIVGLDFLYRQVEKAEQIVQGRIDPTVRVFVAGNDPLTGDMPRELLTCSFHWYAVSACNFVKLIGWIRHQQDAAASPTPEKYVEVVLPEVLPWRNKVAAHFAKTFPVNDKRERDSAAERDASVLALIGFSDDAFVASPFTLSIRRGGVASTSSAIRPWSLTKVHRQLRARYWPVQAMAGQSDDPQAV